MLRIRHAKTLLSDPRWATAGGALVLAAAGIALLLSSSIDSGKAFSSAEKAEALSRPDDGLARCDHRRPECPSPTPATQMQTIRFISTDKDAPPHITTVRAAVAIAATPSETKVRPPPVRTIAAVSQPLQPSQNMDKPSGIPASKGRAKAARASVEDVGSLSELGAPEQAFAPRDAREQKASRRALRDLDARAVNARPAARDYFQMRDERIP